MDYTKLVEMGLDGDGDLKVIMCGEVQRQNQDKIGVVSLVYATLDKFEAEDKLQQLTSNNPENYYMVYSAPLDIELNTLTHYPSIAITGEDLK